MSVSHVSNNVELTTESADQMALNSLLRVGRFATVTPETPSRKPPNAKASHSPSGDCGGLTKLLLHVEDGGKRW